MSSLKSTIAAFNQLADETTQSSSEQYEARKWDKNTKEYGRPPPGSKTERRGMKAGAHIAKEVLDCCEYLSITGTLRPDGTTDTQFHRIFTIYEKFSSKVVGMLLRARKYGLVAFEGEMLYQRQDDNVVITLLYPIDEIRKRLQSSGDPEHCIKIK